MILINAITKINEYVKQYDKLEMMRIYTKLNKKLGMIYLVHLIWNCRWLYEILCLKGKNSV